MNGIRIIFFCISAILLASCDGPSNSNVITLDGVATVNIPSEAFSKNPKVLIGQTDLADFQEVFDEFTSIFSIGQTLDQSVTVELEDQQPLVPLDIEIVIPNSFLSSIPSNTRIVVLALAENESDSELPYPYFTLITGDLDLDNSRISFQARPALFSDLGGNSENFTGIFAVGTAPGSN